MAKIKEILKKIKSKTRPYHKWFVCFIPLLLMILFISNLQSKGDLYYSRLISWYSAAYVDDWNKADRIEKTVEKEDIEFYKSRYHPVELERKIQILFKKEQKTAEDWLEIARIQITLDRYQDALKSVSEAKKIDPIRDDIEKLYFNLQQK